MASLANTILRAWECVHSAPRLQRPAVLLAALSGISEAEALSLGVACRDAALLEWRVALFGSIWTSFAQCPACHVMVEYDMPVAAESGAMPPDSIEVASGEQKLTVRWPNSQDLLDAAACQDRESARSLVTSRICSRPVDDSEVATVLEELGKAHRACGTLALNCCSCPHSWKLAFQPGEFLWHEIRATAGRIFRDVDALARLYHWSEAEILAMSEARRNHYLEMIQ